MTGYIYTLDDARSGNPIYIGSTTDPKKRYYAHRTLSRAGGNSLYDHLLNNKIDFSMSILDTVDAEYTFQIVDLEIFWIELFRQWGFTLLNRMYYKSNPNKDFRKPKKQYNPTQVRMPEDVLHFLQEEAHRLDRSLNWLILSILKKHPSVAEYLSKKKTAALNKP